VNTFSYGKSETVGRTGLPLHPLIVMRLDAFPLESLILPPRWADGSSLDTIQAMLDDVHAIMALQLRLVSLSLGQPATVISPQALHRFFNLASFPLLFTDGY
jgi:hypothetical protein